MEKHSEGDVASDELGDEARVFAGERGERVLEGREEDIRGKEICAFITRGARPDLAGCTFYACAIALASCRLAVG